MPDSTLTWLHLSDLHWREAQAHDIRVVTGALLDDLTNRTKISKKLAHIDLVFVTGDLAFSGSPKEYSLAHQFLTEVLRTTQVRKDRLFVVPGNHDVDRSMITTEARDIAETLVGRQAVNRLLDNDVQRVIFMERLHRYQQFANEYLGNHLPFDNVRFFYVRNRRLSGRRVAIIGLNSVWNSGSDQDRQNLLIGERQVRTVLKQSRESEVRIALVHHPLDWLRDTDRADCEALLLRNCDFLLHGHLHQTGLVELRAPGTHAMVIAAGACYASREYPNAYNLVNLDFDSGRGTIYLRMYSDKQGGFWTKDVLTYPEAQGSYDFPLPEEWHRSTRPMNKVSTKVSLHSSEQTLADLDSNQAAQKQHVSTQISENQSDTRRIELVANGIQGLVNQWPLQPHIVVQLGSSIGWFVKSRSNHPVVVIGRDTRQSGPKLVHNLVAGLTGNGVDVIDLGIMTRPGVAFMTRRLDADVGIVVSAGDSPLEQNGIYLIGSKGMRLQREEELDIERLVYQSSTGFYVSPSYPGQQSEAWNLVHLYVRDLVERCPARRLSGLMLVLDCANGAASRIAPAAFEQLGAHVEVINASIDGHRINYRCGYEYAQRFPSELADIVSRGAAHFGLVFDVDGTRLLAVDPRGTLYDGNDFLFLLTDYFLAEGVLRERKVASTAITARELEEALRSLGVDMIPVSTGQKGLEAALWSEDLFLGGEPTGEIIVNDGKHTSPDAIYTAILVSGVLMKRNAQGLEQLVSPYRRLRALREH